MTDVQKQPMDQASDAYQKIVKSGLESMTSAADEINAMTKERIRNVPVAYFQANVLPIVRAWVKGDKTDMVGHWMNVADGINNPINIVNEAGELVLTCPPPFVGTPSRDQAPTSRFTTAHQVVQQQADMLANGDTRGVMAIENSLIDIYKPRPEDHEKTVAILQLVAVYRYFGLPLEEVLGPNAQEFMKNLTEGLGKVPDAPVTSAPVTTGVDNGASDDDLVY